MRWRCCARSRPRAIWRPRPWWATPTCRARLLWDTSSNSVPYTQAVASMAGLPIACITAPIQAIQRENTGPCALDDIPNGYAVNVYVKPPWASKGGPFKMRERRGRRGPRASKEGRFPWRESLSTISSARDAGCAPMSARWAYLELDPDVITARAIIRPIAPTWTSARVAPPARPCAPTWPSRLKGSSMAEKVLMKGNEAMAEAAMRAGCRFFFGYPITPQTEVAGLHVQAHAEGGRHVLAGESPRSRPSTWCTGLGSRRARHDVVLVAGHLAQGRGHLVYGRRRPAGRHRQRAARRSGPRRHPALPGRLLAGHAARSATATSTWSCTRPPRCRRWPTTPSRPSTWPTSTACPS